MVEVKAIIRREKFDLVKQQLAEKGFNGLTHWHVMGRGKQKGVVIDGVCYDELPKEMVYLVVQDEDKTEVVTTIIHTAKTLPKGKAGDGRIFVRRIDESYTISTQLM